MATSFINERTAELYLVPELVGILAPIYPKITPIFYWASREGGKLSRLSFENARIKILVFYPRRPKIEGAGGGKIHVKLNQVLFDRARDFQESNINVIAGVPLAQRLEDMVKGVKCLWFIIPPNGSEEIISLVLSQGNWTFPNSLSNSELFRVIEESSWMTWNEAVSKIDLIRKSSTASKRYYYPFQVGDLYKPIYLIIHQ